MQYETINEPITVDCVFKNPGSASVATSAKEAMLPRMFLWRSKTYRIAKINGRWQRREGKFLIYCFAVSDENNNGYELEFNTEDMKWQLLRIGFD